jgi:hypothetical protein
MTGGADGRVILLFNANADSTGPQIILADDNASASAGDRILCGAVSGFNVHTINPNHGCWLWYDSTSTRWRVVSIPTEITTDGFIKLRAGTTGMTLVTTGTMTVSASVALGITIASAVGVDGQALMSNGSGSVVWAAPAEDVSTVTGLECFA